MNSFMANNIVDYIVNVLYSINSLRQRIKTYSDILSPYALKPVSWDLNCLEILCQYLFSIIEGADHCECICTRSTLKIKDRVIKIKLRDTTSLFLMLDKD